MKKSFLPILFCLTSLSLSAQTSYGDYPIQGVPFSHVKLTDGFWAPRIGQNRSVTIPIALEQCETTGRILNFDKAAAILQGGNIGYFGTDYTFDDTDIYKILEGMSYSYKASPDAALKARMDTLIAKVGAAQEADGYLMTARTAGKPGALHSWLGPARWEYDPNLSHELYNSGHLFEAATAHYEATGDTTLLSIATRNADLLVGQFLQGGLTYEPGHQIVEMGLVKLYRATGREDYLRLAKYFLDIRGKYASSLKTQYCQSHLPVAEQTEAVGHAVRAVYMYSGMADVAAIMGETSYLSAIDKLWADVVGKKSYITGGIGALHGGEAFGAAYELPNETAYNETCAAIGNVYWNWRMFLLHGDSKYYDALERSLYNNVLSGISLSGDHFFYPNPLQSSGGYTRSAWFGCACCPSNLCRFLASVPGYVYAQKDGRVYVNLFISGEATIPVTDGDSVRLTQTTGMPWEGDVALTIDKPSAEAFKLYVRLPGWAAASPLPGNLYSYLDGKDSKVEIKVNGTIVDYTTDQGYAVIERQWAAGDKVAFTLPMDVHRVVASDLVAEDKGKVALERGPIVYCLEWPDNGGRVQNSVVKDDAAISVVDDSETFADHAAAVKSLKIEGECMTYGADDKAYAEAKTLTAMPYYTWANRGDGEMEVWIAREEGSAKATRDKVAHTDTLKYELGQVPSSFVASGYPSVAFTVDRRAVEQTLGIGEHRLASLFGGEVTFACLEPSGNINESNTAIAPGQWLNYEGKVVTYCDPAATTNTVDQSIVFSELSTAGPTFSIGHYPTLCKEGDDYSFRQMLTRVPTDGSAPSRVVLCFTLHITSAEKALDYAKANAQAFLGNALYAHVTGSERTTLEKYAAQTATTESAQKTLAANIYAAIKAFVAVRGDGDETSKYLTNPSFENSTTGWTVTLQGSGSTNIVSESAHAATDGSMYCGFWRSTLTSADFHQQVTLPAGTYKMSVDTEYSCNGDTQCRWATAQLYFGTDKSEAMPFDTSKSGKNVWQTFEHEFTLDQETTALFGALFIPEASGTWGHIDNFRLAKVSDPSGIVNVKDIAPKTDGKAYRLNGQPAPRSARGLLIKDGRITLQR